MEFKGTKSKWEVQFDTAGYPSVIYEDGNFICDVIGADIEAKANAQLIANAPKMLEMLNRIFIEKCNGVNNIDYSEIEKVINQATKID